jgi:hypothetical protein
VTRGAAVRWSSGGGTIRVDYPAWRATTRWQRGACALALFGIVGSRTSVREEGRKGIEKKKTWLFPFFEGLRGGSEEKGL